MVIPAVTWWQIGKRSHDSVGIVVREIRIIVGY